VAADGTLISDAPMASALPTVAVTTPPVGPRDTAPTLLAELSLLAAAPTGLRAHVSRLFNGPEGLTAALRGGPDLWFGDASRPHAKWLAAERLLADAGAQGINYIDVRTPERPAARIVGAPSITVGGLSGSAVAGDSATALDDALVAAATSGTAGEASTSVSSSGTGLSLGDAASAPAAASAPTSSGGPSGGSGLSSAVTSATGGPSTASGGATAGGSSPVSGPAGSATADSGSPPVSTPVTSSNGAVAAP
jgi:hypothetical protein